MADGLGIFAAISLKATLVIALAALAAVVLRRQSAAMRHLVWLAALSMVLVLPLAVSFMPPWRPDLPMRIENSAPAGRIVVEVVGVAGERPLASSEWPWVLWGCGAVAVLLGTIGAHLRAAVLAHRGVPFPVPAAAPVRLTAAVPVPLVCGIRRQVILLPEEASSWAGERLGSPGLRPLRLPDESALGN